MVMTEESVKKLIDTPGIEHGVLIFKIQNNRAVSVEVMETVNKTKKIQITK